MSLKLTPEEREWKSLALARYTYFPKNLKLCVGRYALTSEQILAEIQRESEVGIFLIRVEKFYLQSIKKIDWSKYE